MIEFNEDHYARQENYNFVQIFKSFPNAVMVGALNEEDFYSQENILNETQKSPIILGSAARLFASNHPGAAIFELQEIVMDKGQLAHLWAFATKVVGADIVLIIRSVFEKWMNTGHRATDNDVKHFLSSMTKSFPTILTEELMREMESGVAL